MLYSVISTQSEVFRHITGGFFGTPFLCCVTLIAVMCSLTSTSTLFRRQIFCNQYADQQVFIVQLLLPSKSLTVDCFSRKLAFLNERRWQRIFVESFLCNFLHFPVSFVSLDGNILGTHFSNALNLYSYCKLRD
jgi:hypothetical protein